MNRVWKIIEERKSGSHSLSDYRGGMSSRRMVGRKEGDSYEDGVKDGFCAAIDILEEHLKEWDKD